MDIRTYDETKRMLEIIKWLIIANAISLVTIVFIMCSSYFFSDYMVPDTNVTNTNTNNIGGDK